MASVRIARMPTNRLDLLGLHLRAGSGLIILKEAPQLLPILQCIRARFPEYRPN